MNSKRYILIPLILSLFLLPCSAHPGATDSKGGHYNHFTGEYHYHHGYPAHQHPNGTCPYDFDDQTGENSVSSSASSSPNEPLKASAYFSFNSAGPILIIAISLAFLLLFIIIRSLSAPRKVKRKGFFSLLYILVFLGIGLLGTAPSFIDVLNKSLSEHIKLCWESVIWSLYLVIPVGGSLSGTFTRFFYLLFKKYPDSSQHNKLCVCSMIFGYILSIPCLYLYLSGRTMVPSIICIIVVFLYFLNDKYNNY